MEENISRLKWACRRGMLELDVILRPFVDNHYHKLSDTEKQQFHKLLTADDPELFAWFMGHEKCPVPELALLIKKVHKLNGALVNH